MKNDRNDMTNETITIRDAVADDVPFIKLCIHELAEYERSAEKDESTEDMVREKHLRTRLCQSADCRI